MRGKSFSNSRSSDCGVPVCRRRAGEKHERWPSSHVQYNNNVQYNILMYNIHYTIYRYSCTICTIYSKCSNSNVVVWCFGGLVVRATASHLWGQEFESCVRTSDHTWKELVNTLPKVMGFLRVPPTGKLTGWVRINS